ncbi:Uncharacterised protein [uncultured archaeon]|nr:Uncharacterised protein [uncultured archaeon]
MARGIKRSRKSERKIVITEGTMWTKTQISVLAFFAKNNNRPSTYIEIARAYVSASYSNYQKACEALVRGSWLEKTDDGSFKVVDARWSQVKENKFVIEREFPFMRKFLKKVRKLKN